MGTILAGAAMGTGIAMTEHVEEHKFGPLCRDCYLFLYFLYMVPVSIIVVCTLPTMICYFWLAVPAVFLSFFTALKMASTLQAALKWSYGSDAEHSLDKELLS